MKKLIKKLKYKIAASTPEEDPDSDLAIIHRATRLSTARMPQGYTHDDIYYYFLSQIASKGKAKNDLRLTRIKYKGLGKYSIAYMTLKQFGHGTNIDCAVSGGITWLWTGSDPQRAGGTATISCFRFKPKKTLYRHGEKVYRIPIQGSASRYGTNCYPAISADGSQLAVRFTNNGDQQFQIYDLHNGTTIEPEIIKQKIKMKKTTGDFQGFDLHGTTIYTIEGSAEKSELREMGKASYYSPIRIRTCDYATGQMSSRKITGAAKLDHREPEGIQVDAEGNVQIMIASHYKELYTCANVYEVK